MTEDQVRQAVREMFNQMHGFYPTDSQAQEFVQRELRPVIEHWKRLNETPPTN